MLLSDISANGYARVMLVGSSGAGKTIGACTFPGKKVVADFDNKIVSAAEFYKEDKALLSDIEVNQYGKMSVKGLAGNKPRMRAFLDDLQGYYDLQNKKQKLPFDTLILDTITTMADSILEDYRYVSQTAVKRPNADQNSQSDYGLLATHIKQIVTGCLALDCNLVMIGHSQLEKDETTGAIVNKIMFPGQMSDKLGIYFTETYLAKIDAKGNHIWQTKADTRSPFCKTAKKGLAAEVPANFNSIK